MTFLNVVNNIKKVNPAFWLYFNNNLYENFIIIVFGPIKLV